MSPEVSRTVFAEGFGFLEAPRWREDRLWASDMAGHCVVALDESGQLAESLPTPGRPSGLGWLPTGEMIVVIMEAKRILRRSDERWDVHADLGEVVLSGDLNDMVVSSSGNAYVTGLGFELDALEQRPTRVALVRPDGSSALQEGEVWVPNGCVITPDEKRFIVAETRLHRLMEFTIAGDGTLVDPRVFGVLPSGSWSDGICLDAAGAVWVADPKGSRCFRMSPNGEVVETIDTAPTPCIACTLGGEDGRTLFLLLSNLGDMDALNERREARIDVIRVDVPGSGSP